MARLHVRTTDSADRDIAAILRWSIEEFGEGAALRYRALIHRAFDDLADDPLRPGAQQWPELQPGIFVYHLRHSRDRARTSLGLVHTPRHVVLYRIRARTIEILRVIHDARDLERHLP